jgi:hypothetical protein
LSGMFGFRRARRGRSPHACLKMVDTKSMMVCLRVNQPPTKPFRG